MASRDDNNDIILLVDAVRSSRSSRVYHRHSVIGPTYNRIIIVNLL